LVLLSFPKMNSAGDYRPGPTAFKCGTTTSAMMERQSQCQTNPRSKIL